MCNVPLVSSDCPLICISSKVHHQKLSKSIVLFGKAINHIFHAEACLNKMFFGAIYSDFINDVITCKQA